MATRSTRLRRLRRILVGVLATLLGVVVLLAIAISIRPVREEALRRGVGMASRALPGELRVSRSHWIAIEQLEFEGIVWTQEGDTLLSSSYLRVDPDLRALLHKDVHVRLLQIDALRLDLPGVLEAFPSTADSSEVQEEESVPPSFPRPGLFPGVPSLAVDRLEVQLGGLVLPEDRRLEGNLHLELETRPDRDPRLESRVQIALDDREPVRLEAGETGAGAWGLRLGTASDPGLVELGIAGLERWSNRRDPLDLELTVVLPDSTGARSFPVLDSLLLAQPELAGASLHARGPIRLADDTLQAELQLQLRSWPLLQAADGRLEWDGASGELELDILEAQGLTGRIHATGPEPETRAELVLDVQRGLDASPWLEPDALPPDLGFHLSAEFGLVVSERKLELDLESSAGAPSRGLERAFVQLRVEGEPEDLRGRAQIAARGPRWDLNLQSEAAYDEVLELRLSPVLARFDPEPWERPPAPPALDAESRVQLSIPDAALELEHLGVEGDFGRGRLDLSAAKDAPRMLGLDWRWPTRPRALDLLADSNAVESAVLDSLWVRDGGYSVALELVERAPRAERFDADLSAHLPAPWRVLPQLPRERRGYGEPLDLRAHAAGGLDSLELQLHAEPNDWLQSMGLELRHAAAHSVLDSLRLELEGVLLTARGERTGEDLLGEADLAFHNDPLLREFLGESLPQVSARAAARLELSGTIEAPNADLLLGGELSSVPARVDSLTLRARVRDGSLADAHLATRGLSYQRWNLERADLQWRAEGKDLFPGLAALELHGKGLDVVQVARVLRDSVWTVEVDTLGLRISERDLLTERPFLIGVDPERRRARVDGLALRGTLGRARADMRFGPRTKEGRAELELELPDPPRALRVPKGAWPARFELSLELDAVKLEAQAQASGIGLGSERNLTLSFDAQSNVDSLGVSLDLRGEERVLLEGNAQLPLGFVPDGPRWETRPGHPTLSLRIDALPLPARLQGLRSIEDYFLGRGQKQAPRLHGRLELSQGAGQTEGALQARVSFEQIPELADDTLEITGVSISSGELSSRLSGDPELHALLQRARERMGERGQGFRVEWRSEGEPRLWMSAFAPPLWNPEAGRLEWRDKEVVAQLQSDQLQLSDFNRFLPERFRIQGAIEADLSARGTTPSLELDGKLTGKGLTFADPGRAEATADLDFRFSGRTDSPTIRGNIVMDKGTVRIPESRKSFHVSEGASILWDAARAATEGDSTLAPVYGPTALQSAEDSTRARSLVPKGTDMSVDLDIPRNLWIRGRGLDIRLNGKLRMTQEEGRPVVVGRLQTVDGRFSFMSKTFRATRGDVEFFGDPTNPSLDIELTARVSDVTIIVRIQGTAQRPELELRSDPYMEEGDIMSYLLFGGPTASLDQAGADLLNQQAVNALEGFAIPALEGGVGSELGLSMISLTQNEDASKGMNIMVGRYITPEILLRYEMSLEDSQDYNVNLEYWMTHRLSLQTHYSQARASGIDLNWTKDY